MKKIQTLSPSMRPARRKIEAAYQAITESPVDAKTFAKSHGISVYVLRQAKRFDTGDNPKKVRCGLINKQLFVWRE